MRIIYRGIRLLTVLLNGLAGVRAQVTSEVVCGAGYNYLYNSLNQTPCLVFAYLSSVCSNNQWDEQPLPGPSYVIIGPTGNLINPCQCSTVTYSMASACADCQGAGWYTWDEWIGPYCSSGPGVSIMIFPYDIPAGTAVPEWAFYNVTASGTFVHADAIQDDGPDSTHTGATPTSTGSSSTSTSVTTTSISSTTSASSSASSPSNPAKKSDTGAIAGGVVGGVVGLAVLALVGFIVARGRYRHGAQADAMPETQTSLMDEKSSNFRSAQNLPLTAEPFNVGRPFAPKPYDPNDPSTFPVSTNASMMSHSGGTSTYNPGHGVAGIGAGGAAGGMYYTGRPEV